MSRRESVKGSIVGAVEQLGLNSSTKSSWHDAQDKFHVNYF